MDALRPPKLKGSQRLLCARKDTAVPRWKWDGEWLKQAHEVRWGPIAPGTSGRRREVNEMRAATSPCGIGNARRSTVRGERVVAGQVV